MKQFSYSIIVPKFQLKYMLSGHLHVTWQENKTTGYNYTFNICCSKTWSHLYFGCPSFCPQFQAINSCKQVSSGPDTQNRQCSLIVYGYFEYTLYLSGKQHECHLTGKAAEFKPMLRSK